MKPRYLIAFVAVLLELAVARAQAPLTPDDGWLSSSPEAQGLDSEALAQAFDFIRDRRVRIHSLVLVRNGHLVLDAYFFPFEPGQMHDVASVTKSITSTLVGIAIDEHKLQGLEARLLDVFPQPVTKGDERRRRITLETLLTMSGGWDCRAHDAEITLREMRQSKDWLQYMIDLPMVADPGDKFEYCSSGMHVLSAVVSKATGQSALKYAEGKLFGPLGIEDVAWPADPSGVTFGWGDLHLKPRDMAKIGQLWLDRGRWKGVQIVSAAWMKDATRTHTRVPSGSGYGYGFWIYPDRNPPLYEALGRGGQRISVVPSENLIAVFTGGEFEPGDIGKFISAALKSDAPIPENAAARSRLTAAIAAATRPPPARALVVEPSLASAISGVTYAIEANPLQLKSISLRFSGTETARVVMAFEDGRVEDRPAGMDGVPRLSSGGRFGLPVALEGRWESADTFPFDYDEVANINSFQFRLVFVANGVNAAVSEKTGLLRIALKGTPVRPPASK